MKPTWQEIAARFGADPSKETQVVRCPKHDDRTASLGIGYVGGVVMIKCHAGCDTEAVVAAVNLKMADLFPGDRKAKTEPQKKIVATYDYKDEQGRLLFQKLRYEPKDFRARVPKDGGGWEWKLNGARRVPYRLPDLIAAVASAWVLFPEGEKDCDNLAKLGFVASTNFEGASKDDQKPKWRAEYNPFFKGRKVVLLPDNDDAGRARVKAIATAIYNSATEIRLVELPGLLPKGDVSDWIVARRTEGKSDQQIRDELQAIIEAAPHWNGGDQVEADTSADEAEKTPAITPVSFGDLRKSHPRMRCPVIHGLARQGEVVNVAAAPKFGKSWLGQQMALAAVFGRQCIGFTFEQGDVLLVDDELHPETIVSRFETLARAWEVDIDEIEKHVQIISLRGRLLDLEKLELTFAAIERGRFLLVILDALYRLLPPGADENSNADMARLYNLIDQYAAMTGAAFIAIHHTSKGNQGSKSITDVGAGAGSQSRAADAHLVIREHEQEGGFVIHGVCRSFPSPKPFCVRRNFPLWERADDLDPTQIKVERPARRSRTSDGVKPIEAWTVERFVRECIAATPRDTKTVKAFAAEAGCSIRQADVFLQMIREDGHAHYRPKQGTRPAVYSTEPFGDEELFA